MERRDMERRRFDGYYQGSSGTFSQFGFEGPDDEQLGGGHQNFGDDARWKNDIRAEHINNDHFGRGIRDRQWNKHLDNYPHEGKSTHYGKGPKGYRRSPESVQDDVYQALTHSPEVDATDIDFRFEDGVLTLTGIVKSRRMKKAAERVVERISGIEDVINLLSPEGEGLKLWEVDQSI